MIEETATALLPHAALDVVGVLAVSAWAIYILVKLFFVAERRAEERDTLRRRIADLENGSAIQRTTLAGVVERNKYALASLRQRCHTLEEARRLELEKAFLDKEPRE